MKGPILGIDLGTSNTVVAACDASGTPAVLSGKNGAKVHPSVVSFHPNGKVIVGADAKQRRIIDPKNTVYSVKRLIGRTFDSREVQVSKSRAAYQIREGENRQPVIKTRAGEFSVPEISALVLDFARNLANTALGADAKEAVITVPANFTDQQRSGTASAGAIAGLKVLRVLNEPTAAALAYGDMRSLNQTIAVYDFGGGTFDVTVLRLEDQRFEVLGTAGDSFLGGDDIDERMVDRLVASFLTEQRVDLRGNDVAMMRLRAVAEQTKIELSRRSRAIIKVDEIAYGPGGVALNLQQEITRDQLVASSTDVVERTFSVCDEALRVAGLSKGQIDDIVLVGGSTKMPFVRDRVAAYFGKAPRTDLDPDTAVAVGAALQGFAMARASSAPATGAVGFPATDQDASTDNEPTASAGAPLPSQWAHVPKTPANPGGTANLAAAPQKLPHRPETERAAERGGHVDKFEDRRGPSVPIARIGGPGPMRVPNIPRADTPAGGVPTRRTPPAGIPARPDAPPPPAGIGGPSRVDAPHVPQRHTPASGVPRHVEGPGSGTAAAALAAAKPQRAMSPMALSPPPVLTPSPVFPSAPPAAPNGGFAGLAKSPVAGPDQPTRGLDVFEPPMRPSAPTIDEETIEGLTLDEAIAESVRDPAPPPTAPAPTAWGAPANPGPSIAVTSRGLPPAPAIGDDGAEETATAARPHPASPPAAKARSVATPVVMDVTPRALGIGTIGGFCEELVKRNARLPVEVKRKYTTSRDSQDTVRLQVCQGESRRLQENTVLGDLVLDRIEPRPRGDTTIEVTFAIDASGILSVRARDARTGREQSCSLDVAGSLSEGDVVAARNRLSQLQVER